MGAHTLRDEWWFACRPLREDHPLIFPYSFPEKILGIDKSTVRYHHSQYETVRPIAGRDGRRPLVTEEHPEELVQRTAEAYQHVIPWKIGGILQFIHETSHELVDKNRYNKRHTSSHAKEYQWRTSDSRTQRKRPLITFNGLLRASRVYP
jgi:hypothetical protein